MRKSEVRSQKSEVRIQNKKFSIINRASCIKKYFASFLLFTVHYSLFTAAAFASEEGGHHSASLKDWLWPVINFAVLVFILVKFGRKPMKEYFIKRTEIIEKSLKEAGEAKELAKKALSDVQERLKGMDEEINKILESAKRAGENDKEALIAQGASLKNKILEQTRVNIRYELQNAKKAIKSEAALMALELAEKQIKERLGGKEQERLIEENIKKFAGN